MNKERYSDFCNVTRWFDLIQNLAKSSNVLNFIQLKHEVSSKKKKDKKKSPKKAPQKSSKQPQQQSKQNNKNNKKKKKVCFGLC